MIVMKKVGCLVVCRFKVEMLPSRLHMTESNSALSAAPQDRGMQIALPSNDDDFQYDTEVSQSKDCMQTLFNGKARFDQQDGARQQSPAET